MAKYINADALIERVKRYCKQWSDITGDYKHGVVDAFDVFNSAVFAEPAADVRENVRGEWEIMEDADGCTYYRCSACHRFRFHNGAMLKKYRFCPICGAKNRPKTMNNL